MFVLDILNAKNKMPDPKHALKGRETEIESGEFHFVNRNPMHGSLSRRE